MFGYFAAFLGVSCFFGGALLMFSRWMEREDERGEKPPAPKVTVERIEVRSRARKDGEQ